MSRHSDCATCLKGTDHGLSSLHCCRDIIFILHSQLEIAGFVLNMEVMRAEHGFCRNREQLATAPAEMTFAAWVLCTRLCAGFAVPACIRSSLIGEPVVVGCVTARHPKAQSVESKINGPTGLQEHQNTLKRSRARDTQPQQDHMGNCLASGFEALQSHAYMRSYWPPSFPRLQWCSPQRQSEFPTYRPPLCGLGQGWHVQPGKLDTPGRECGQL